MPYEYIPELRTEITVGCDGVVRYLAKKCIFTCQGKDCEVFLKKGGNTGFYACPFVKDSFFLFLYIKHKE